MSDPKPTAPPAEATAGKGAVIRRLEAARETSQERLMKKHLPAWVISGAVNVGVIAFLMLVFGGRTVDAKGPEKIVATPVEKQDEQPDKDLTNEDQGLQSNIEAAIDVDRVEQKTIDSAVTADALGLPNAPDLESGSALPGISASDFTNVGAPGDAGGLMEGGGSAGNSTGAHLGRSGSTKTQLLREGGGNEKSEAAVARGLAWLARQQKPDGSWIYDQGKKEEVVAATGMALLPFLAAGETHKKNGRYKKTVESGLNFLLKILPLSGANAGKFIGSGATDMYGQAIGTLVLCEAYGMTKDKGGALFSGAQAAINFIQRAQGANGSWGYGPGATGDTSIVGWQVQALEAAILSKDLVVDARVIKRAIDFLNLAGAGSRKAMYGYGDSTGAAPGTALTAVGLLCRYYIDRGQSWGPDSAAMAEGVKGLMAKKPVAATVAPDMYFYYYATQVVHFFEGEDWREWNEGKKGADGKRSGGMRDWLVNIQINKAGANEGSYDPEGGWIGRSCGRLGTTAMCLLTLEVYYRHLPLYKRGQNNDTKILDGK